MRAALMTNIGVSAAANAANSAASASQAASNASSSAPLAAQAAVASQGNRVLASERAIATAERKKTDAAFDNQPEEGEERGASLKTTKGDPEAGKRLLGVA